MLGLRQVERDAAARLSAVGYMVYTPDLYTGQSVNTLEEGFELKERVGWTVICTRAAQAMSELPDATVLAGFSMGLGSSPASGRNDHAPPECCCFTVLRTSQ
jgi:dienelactone hydrolase